MIVLVFIFTNTTIAKAEGAPRIRDSVVFDHKLSDDKSALIPIVRVTSDNYSDGTSTIQEYSFPEAMIKIPENASYIEEKDTSKPNTLAIGCGWKPYSMMFQLSTGYTAYQVECYGMYNTQTGKETGPEHSRLLQFDLSTKKLKVLRQIDSMSYNSRINLYRNFKGYSVSTEEPEPSRPGDYRLKKVYVYSFETNKQIAVVNDNPRDGDPLIGNYDRVLEDNTILLEENNTINGKQSMPKYFQLYPDGHKTEVFPNPHLGSERWGKKIGEIRYAEKYDSKRKDSFVGYTLNGKFTPLSPGNSKVLAGSTFSPNNTHLIISYSFRDPKAAYEATIVDVKTAKVLYTLPAHESGKRLHGYHWVNDDLVRINFNIDSFSGYLHVPTGIITKKGKEDYWGIGRVYSGNYSDLLTPEAPAQIIVNGKNVVYSGQGPFRLYKGDGALLVPLNDFAMAINAAVSVTKDGWQIQYGDQTIMIAKSKSTMFQGRAYVPLKTLTDQLGIKATVKEKDYE